MLLLEGDLVVLDISKRTDFVIDPLDSSPCRIDCAVLGVARPPGCQGIRHIRARVRSVTELFAEANILNRRFNCISRIVRINLNSRIVDRRAKTERLLFANRQPEAHTATGRFLAILIAQR